MHGASAFFNALTHKEEKEMAVINVAEVEAIVGTNYDVREHEVIKNGVTKKALTVIPKGGCLGVTFYEENLFALVGEDLEEFILKSLETLPEYDVQEQLPDFENLKIGVKVQALNKPIPEGTAYREVLDMALIPVILTEINGGSGLIKVNKYLLGLWEKTLDEVMDRVDTNYVFRNLNEELKGMIPDELIEAMPQNPMNILRNKEKANGAGLILFENVQKDIFEKIGSYYVLPSSIHEVLIIPQNEAPEVSELYQMVKEVNETQVAPEDRLTDTVYFYDGEKLTIA